MKEKREDEPATTGPRVEPVYKQIGENLRRLRNERMSQKELADSVGMTISYISHIESGGRRVPIHVLLGMAEKLGVELDDILGTKKKAGK